MALSRSCSPVKIVTGEATSSSLTFALQLLPKSVPEVRQGKWNSSRIQPEVSAVCSLPIFPATKLRVERISKYL